MEIRVVPEAIVATASDEKLLSSYFNGNNKKKVCIKPASPLMIQGQSYQYIVRDAPIPMNDQIKIKVLPPRKIAVDICDNYESSLSSLMGKLAHHGLHAAGRPFLIEGKQKEIAVEID